VFQDHNGVRVQFPSEPGAEHGLTEGVATLGRDGNSAIEMDERRYQHDWTVLPAGTSISVRTEDIDSRNAAEGRTFPAAIVQDVLDANGSAVIPRGSGATLVGRRATEVGTLTGASYSTPRL